MYAKTIMITFALQMQKMFGSGHIGKQTYRMWFF